MKPDDKDRHRTIEVLQKLKDMPQDVVEEELHLIAMGFFLCASQADPHAVQTPKEKLAYMHGKDTLFRFLFKATRLDPETEFGPALSLFPILLEASEERVEKAMQESRGEQAH